MKRDAFILPLVWLFTFFGLHAFANVHQQSDQAVDGVQSHAARGQLQQAGGFVFAGGGARPVFTCLGAAGVFSTVAFGSRVYSSPVNVPVCGAPVFTN